MWLLRFFVVKKTERPVLDRPLKVGGGVQPLLVTVLTPATTFTVGLNCSQKARAVKRGDKIFPECPYFLALPSIFRRRREMISGRQVAREAY
jgi:hypothetical protein